MSENAQGAPPRVVRGGKLTEIRLAAGFLTILPLLPRAAVAPETLAASFGWFPLVGFALGALLTAENLVLTPPLGDALAAVMLVLTLTVLTGAVHVDALADTTDALGAGSDRRRALEIMRDSRIGTFGAAAIFFFFALEQLDVRPILDLEMRLGEGTGAALAMSVIEAALALFHEMATFESAGVSEKIG